LSGRPRSNDKSTRPNKGHHLARKPWPSRRKPPGRANHHRGHPSPCHHPSIQCERCSDRRDGCQSTLRLFRRYSRWSHREVTTLNQRLPLILNPQHTPNRIRRNGRSHLGGRKYDAWRELAFPRLMASSSYIYITTRTTRRNTSRLYTTRSSSRHLSENVHRLAERRSEAEV